MAPAPPEALFLHVNAWPAQSKSQGREELAWELEEPLTLAPSLLCDLRCSASPL